MANDLREIIGAMRIARDLEGIGDRAKNIAKRALAINESLPEDPSTHLIARMGQLVESQTRRVMQSYHDRSSGPAVDIWDRDVEVDRLHGVLAWELTALMAGNPLAVTRGAHLLFCAKDLERIGDHATNIAEAIAYIVEGEVVHAERLKDDVASLEFL
jgi:phosphate transport system protein